MSTYFATVILLFLLVFSACDLFDPRVPQTPSGGGVAWQDPTSPDIVVENMQASLNGQSATYMDCFSEAFVFYADTSDINEYVSYDFTQWDLSVENATVNALFSIVPEDSTIVSLFTMDPDHSDPSAPVDSVVIYRYYSVTVPGSVHSGTGTPAVGIAELHLVEIEGFWTIKEWHDSRHKTTPFVTWAVAKAVYR